MGQQNVIELNGKRYDAFTGKLLGKSTADVAQSLRPRSVDGVMRRRPSVSKPVATVSESKPQPALKPVYHAKTERKPGKTVKPHSPEHAKTLMRRVVHRPKNALKPAIKVQTPSEVMAAPIAVIAPKRSVKHIDPVRLSRAHHTQKHGQVQKFNQSSRIATSHPAMPPRQARPTDFKTPVRHPEQPTKQPRQDIFEAAIARAHSHEQPAHKSPKHHKKHRRFTGILAGLMAFLIMGGFLAYLNMPKIELKFASVQAGFNARMPGYSPTGYELTDIHNQHGAVSLTFRSGENDYRITQQASNWNSRTLGDDIIATAKHETVESKGRIIYLYGGNASWVVGGVRYDITNNAHLSKDDIVDIATSM